MKLRPGEQASPEALEEGDVLEEHERAIRCAACGGRVTREALRITMNGAHEHVFMNPSGLRFVVQCFSAAPGCVPEGERSSIWSWFPGFAWQIELCRSCGGHLGWSFHASEAGSAPAFYGLIKERLAA